MSDLNEQKIDELLKLMRSVIPDVSDMNDAGKVGFDYREDYDPEASYEPMDVVLFGNSLWEAKTDTIGNPPPDQSQEGQEDVKENEFWRLFLPGALGGDYVKKDDYAQVGFAGIVQPDGKTIKVGDEGLLTAGTAGFTGTKEEYAIAMAEGQIEPGTIVFITDDFSPSAGSNIRIGGKAEIEAALEAGEIEDWTVLVILDDFVEPVVIDKEEIEEIRNTAVSAAANADEAAKAAQEIGKVKLDYHLITADDPIPDSVYQGVLTFSGVTGNLSDDVAKLSNRHLRIVDSNISFTHGDPSRYFMWVTLSNSTITVETTQRINSDLWILLEYCYSARIVGYNRMTGVTMLSTVFGTSSFSNCIIAGAFIAYNTVNFDNCVINANVTLYGNATVNCTNCTGRLIDQNGNNLVS